MTVKTVYKRGEVVEILSAALGKAKTAEYSALEGVLSALQTSIVSFLGQLRDAQPGEIARTHLPSARDELDAVVSATEQATTDIMEACEQILVSVKSAPRPVAKDVEAHTTRIFEACAFQDITGQRIRKATNALRQIDAKIAALLSAIGGEGSGQDAASEGGAAAISPPADSDSASLLNGPALPHNAVSQDDIDKLLAEFDGNNR